MCRINGSVQVAYRVVDQVSRADHILLHGLHLLTELVIALETPSGLETLELLEV